MRFPLFLTCAFLLLPGVHPRAQVPTARFEFSPGTAHLNARPLMKEDWYWSSIDDEAPFGSDAGSDAAYGFYRWRKMNPVSSPVLYLKDLIQSWNFPEIGWDVMDTVKLKEYMSLPAHVDEIEIQRLIQLMKQDKGNQAPPGKKPLTDEQLEQIARNSGKNMGTTFLIELDKSIVGTAFAQFVLEGRVDASLQRFATISLQRGILPILMRKYPVDAQKVHREKAMKLMSVVSKMNH